MVSPVIFYTLIINVIGYFQYFTDYATGSRRPAQLHALLRQLPAVQAHRPGAFSHHRHRFPHLRLGILPLRGVAHESSQNRCVPGRRSKSFVAWKAAPIRAPGLEPRPISSSPWWLWPIVIAWLQDGCRDLRGRRCCPKNPQSTPYTLLAIHVEHDGDRYSDYLGLRFHAYGFGRSQLGVHGLPQHHYAARAGDPEYSLAGSARSCRWSFPPVFMRQFFMTIPNELDRAQASTLLALRHGCWRRWPSLPSSPPIATSSARSSI